jgi:uncharacterized radical SAM protein YgiQ
LKGIKKSFIGSGVRYDLLFPEWNLNAGRDEGEYLEELIKNHISGRLKVAPEHTSPHVLSLMRKVPFDLFRKLKKRFDNFTKKHDLKYEMIPYFISGHPGCTDSDMKELAAEVKILRIKPEQVQDFTPTPMTLSTLMYYTGFDPYTGKKVYVARNVEEKKRQKEYFFWYKTEQRHSGATAKWKNNSTTQWQSGTTAQKTRSGKKESGKGRKGDRIF